MRAAGDFRGAAGQLGRSLMDQWESWIPRDELGRPVNHAGPFDALMGFAQGGGLFGEDETGRVSAGLQGFSVTRRGRDGRDAWNLSVDPAGQSLQVGGKDISAGVNWNSSSPSGELRLGSLRLSGGRGQAPGGSGTMIAPAVNRGGFLDDGLGRSQGSDAPIPAGRPGNWGRIDFRVGQPAMGIPEEMISGLAEMKSNQAVAPFAVGGAPERSVPSARDELDAQLLDYRNRNQYWYRP